MKKKESGFTLIELLIVIAIIGILAAIAIPNLLNAVQRGKQKRTMADMRSLATAVEAYAVDNNNYVSGTCAPGVFTTYNTTPMDSNSLSALSPTYIGNPPRIDGWGNFMYYNTTDNQTQYNIVSLGRDHSIGPYQGCGTTTDFNDDIIYANGSFAQWPEGTQK